MLKYAILSYIFLLIGVHCHEPDEFMKSFYNSPVPLPQDYLIAPEVSHDKKSFAVLHYKQQESQPLKLQVELYILNEISVDKSRKCVVELTARNEADIVGVSALNRLANNKLVFTWYEEETYKRTVHRRYTVEVVNMTDSCDRMNLGLGHFTENPIVVTSLKSEILDVLVNDDHRCNIFGPRCRIYFNFEHGIIGRRHPFKVKSNWTSIQVKRFHDRDLLIYDQQGETFKASRVQMIEDKDEEIFFKVIGKPNMEVVATGLSVCWNVHPGTTLEVKCLQFNERMDNYLLKQNVNLYQDVHLIDVHATSRGEVLLVAKKYFCTDDDDDSENDCWKLMLMKIEQGHDDADTEQIFFPCTGDQKRLVIFSSLLNPETQKIDVHYACRNGNGYAYSYLEI